MKNLPVLPLLFVLILAAACKKERIEPISIHPDLVLVNEGVSGAGNASLTALESANSNGNAITKAFELVNGSSLGDNASHATQWKNHIFVVISGSEYGDGKIVRTDLNLNLSGELTGLRSPKQMLIVSDQKAYVTDSENHEIYIVDPYSFQLTGVIATDAPSEAIMRHEEEVFITQSGTNRVLIIDINSDQIVDTLITGMNPVELGLDGYGGIWVLCQGTATMNAQLMQFDLVSRASGKVHTFPQTGDIPSSLTFDQAGWDMCFIWNGDVYKMSYFAVEPPSEPLISGEGHSFTHVEYNRIWNDLYVTEKGTAEERGLLHRYDPDDASLLNTYLTGVNPGDLLVIYD